jgi:hypothetical protein
MISQPIASYSLAANATVMKTDDRMTGTPLNITGWPMTASGHRRRLDEASITSARLKCSIALRRLIRHPCLHDCFLRRHPKIPRRLQRAPDIGIFRVAIESNQLHTVWALHLIAVAESLRPLAERLAALGTDNLYPVGHEILLQGDYQAVF